MRTHLRHKTPKIYQYKLQFSNIGFNLHQGKSTNGGNDTNDHWLRVQASSETAIGVSGFGRSGVAILVWALQVNLFSICKVNGEVIVDGASSNWNAFELREGSTACGTLRLWAAHGRFALAILWVEALANNVATFASIHEWAASLWNANIGEVGFTDWRDGGAIRRSEARDDSDVLDVFNGSSSNHHGRALDRKINTVVAQTVAVAARAFSKSVGDLFRVYVARDGWIGWHAEVVRNVALAVGVLTSQEGGSSHMLRGNEQGGNSGGNEFVHVGCARSDCVTKMSSSYSADVWVVIESWSSVEMDKVALVLFTPLYQSRANVISTPSRCRHDGPTDETRPVNQFPASSQQLDADRNCSVMPKIHSALRCHTILELQSARGVHALPIPLAIIPKSVSLVWRCDSKWCSSGGVPYRYHTEEQLRADGTPASIAFFLLTGWLSFICISIAFHTYQLWQYLCNSSSTLQHSKYSSIFLITHHLWRAIAQVLR